MNPYEAVLAELYAQRDRIEIAIEAIEALRPGSAPLTPQAPTVAEEDTPPPPPPPKPKLKLPEDPSERQALVCSLFDRGHSQREVADLYGETFEHIDRIFRGEA